MGPFHANPGLLAHREVGLEVGLHGLSCDVVLLLLDDCLAGKSVHGCSNFFFTGCRVVEDVLLPETISEFCFVLDLLLVGFDEVDGFGQGVVIGAEEAVLLELCVLHGTVGPTFSKTLRPIEVGSDFEFIDLRADIPIGVVIPGLSASVDHGVSRLGGWVVGEAELDLIYFYFYFEQLLLVGFLFFHILGHRHAPVPWLFPEAEVVGVYQILDLLLDGFSILRDVLLGEELLVLIVVDLIVADGPDLGLPALLGGQQSSELLFLGGPRGTYFLRRFSQAYLTNIFAVLLLFQYRDQMSKAERLESEEESSIKPSGLDSKLREQQLQQIKLQTFNMQDQNERLTGKPKHIQLPQSDPHQPQLPFYGKCLHNWGECCGFTRTWCPCLCCCFIEYPYKTVPQSYNGIYQKFGRYVKTVKPGLHYINPCTETLGMISTKIHVLDLARQNVITKDNVSINIDTAVYYKVINPRFAYYRVQNFSLAIAEVTYAILKNTCGQFILQDLLEKRQEIADDIEKQVDQYVEEWGVDIQEIFIKDIQLSKDLQDSLSSAAKERRLAESKILSAKADVQAAKLMRLAADELNSKAAMQIRYLETLKQVGRSNTKVIFVPEMKNKDRVNHLITQGLIN